MTRSNKSTPISSRPAAATEDLSQVEQFPSEDSPSQVGSSVSQIPLITWKSPFEFTVNSNWQVADGEESTEANAQKDRELRVLEAIYPRPSSIPPNPILLVDDPVQHDENTPVVRTTPIEDDEGYVLDGSMSAATTNPTESSTSIGTISPEIAATIPVVRTTPIEDDGGYVLDGSMSAATTNPAESSTSIGTISPEIAATIPVVRTTPIEDDGEYVLDGSISAATTNPAESSTSIGAITPEIAAAIRYAFSMTNCSPAEIDFEFLAQILSNSEVVEALQLLVNNHTRSSFISTIETVLQSPRPASSSYPQTTAGPIVNTRPPAPGIILSSSPTLPIPVRKDKYYYRSMIQQHGVDRRDSLLKSGTGQELSNCTRLTPKKSACCKYFNTSRGCRNGTNCLFQHSGQRVTGVSDVPSAKRVKLERKNTST